MMGNSNQPSARARLTGLLLALTGLLLAAGLACSLSGPAAQPVPTPSRTPRPTFTPLGGPAAEAGTPTPETLGALPPGVTAIAPDEATREADTGVNVVIYATPTGQAPLILTGEPQAGPGVSPLATPPPFPSPAPLQRVAPSPTGPTPTPRPTPYVVVQAAQVDARRGPAPSFELLGRVRQGQQLMVLARTPDKSWWQVCCVANQPAWVLAQQVTAQGPVEAAPAVPVPPTPTQTLTPTPTLTPTVTPTPVPPFDIARGPEFPLKRDDGTVVIWAKVYEGPSDNERPLAGYVLKVFRNNVDVSQPTVSHAKISGFDTTGPAQGNFLYNLKFEMDMGGEADWQIYLARPDGSRVSNISKFTTMGDSYRNLVVYIAYFLAR